MAPVSIVSLKISSHLSKVRFVVIIIDPLSFLFDNKLKRISQPDLSNETYPSSSNITNQTFQISACIHSTGFDSSPPSTQ